VPDAVAAMVERYPGINCRVSTGTLEDLTIQIKRCEIDIAFCQSYLPMQIKRGPGDPDIKFETLMRARSRAYAPEAHPLAGRAQISLADVARHGWVVPYQLSLSYRFEDAFIRNEVRVPVQSINSASIQFCKASARRLGLLLLIPDHLMQGEVATGDMVALDIPELEFEHDVGLLMRKMRNTPPVVRSLVDVFRQLCDDEKLTTDGPSTACAG
jgi:DNA-binding transcriptional LysR family regulator